MKDSNKEWIDNANYKKLLHRWRFADSDDEMFLGDTGKYYTKRMSILKHKLSYDEQVAMSKRVGWR